MERNESMVYDAMTMDGFDEYERDRVRAAIDAADLELAKLVRRKLNSLNSVDMDRCVIRRPEVDAIDALHGV